MGLVGGILGFVLGLPLGLAAAYLVYLRFVAPRRRLQVSSVAGFASSSNRSSYRSATCNHTTRINQSVRFDLRELSTHASSTNANRIELIEFSRGPPIEAVRACMPVTDSHPPVPIGFGLIGTS